MADMPLPCLRASSFAFSLMSKMLRRSVGATEPFCIVAFGIWLTPGMPDGKTTLFSLYNDPTPRPGSEGGSTATTGMKIRTLKRTIRQTRQRGTVQSISLPSHYETTIAQTSLAYVIAQPQAT